MTHFQTRKKNSYLKKFFSKWSDAFETLLIFFLSFLLICNRIFRHFLLQEKQRLGSRQREKGKNKSQREQLRKKIVKKCIFVCCSFFFAELPFGELRLPFCRKSLLVNQKRIVYQCTRYRVFRLECAL